MTTAELKTIAQDMVTQSPAYATKIAAQMGRYIGSWLRTDGEETGLEYYAIQWTGSLWTRMLEDFRAGTIRETIERKYLAEVQDHPELTGWMVSLILKAMTDWNFHREWCEKYLSISDKVGGAWNWLPWLPYQGEAYANTVGN